MQGESSRGRIIVEATIENGTHSTHRVRCDALVDTGAACLTLPNAWRERLGPLTQLATVSVETTTQAVVSGDICGPVVLRLERFRPVLAEVLFIEMEPNDGQYEPLIGYIPLEQAQAVVDLVGHRLVEGEPGRSQVTQAGASPTAPSPAPGSPRRTSIALVAARENSRARRARIHRWRSRGSAARRDARALDRRPPAALRLARDRRPGA